MKMVEKLQKRIQEGKKNNKGFSLVELIIVIAIMAILIGIVGMNVIPQINNARKATDAQVVSAMISEAMEVYTQVAQASGDYTITVTNTNGTLSMNKVEAGTSGTAEIASQMKDAFEDLAKLDTRTLKSDDGKKLDITIHCTEADGVYIGKIDATSKTYTPPTGFEGYEFRSR